MREKPRRFRAFAFARKSVRFIIIVPPSETALPFRLPW
jgi:hypothetical protein